MSVTPSVSILNVIIAKIKNKSKTIPVSLLCEQNGNKNVETKALLDTGAGGKFIDQKFVLQNNLRTRKLGKPKLLVTGLGCQKIILGFPWFEEQNPEINWETGTLNWRKEIRTPATSIEVLDKDKYLDRTQNTLDEDEESIISLINVNSKIEPVWINVKTNLAMDMAIKNNLKKQECTVEEMVPKEYHEFLDVFSKGKQPYFQNLKNGIIKLT